MIGDATEGKKDLPACVQTLLNGVSDSVLWHGSSRQTGGIIRIQTRTASEKRAAGNRLLCSGTVQFCQRRHHHCLDGVQAVFCLVEHHAVR